MMYETALKKLVNDRMYILCHVIDPLIYNRHSLKQCDVQHNLLGNLRAPYMRLNSVGGILGIAQVFFV